MVLRCLVASLGLMAVSAGVPAAAAPPDANAVYATAGTWLYRSSVSVAYERRWKRLELGKGADLQLRASAGAYYDLGFFDPPGAGPMGTLGLGLAGEHLDLGLGLYLTAGSMFGSGLTTLPLATVGYRNQREAGGRVFRVGLGFLEGLYVSLGRGF